jgi:quercetin dioxygenase-like cupin family protein
MASVIPIEELRFTPDVALYEGADHDGIPMSVYMTEFGRGEGPPLHMHPYPEVFVVERNTAVFTAGDEELTVGAGHVVVVPANTPHRYLGASDDPVRVLSFQPSGKVEQTNL